VSVEPLQLKVFLWSVCLALLIPQIRKKLFKTSLVIRKCKVALYSTLAFTFLGCLNLTDRSIDFAGLYFVFMLSLLGIFIYGIPVSLFSDFITSKLRSSRFYVSGLLHIGFGLLTYFIGFGILMIFPTFCSIIFFLIDEFLRKREFYT
jgi:hypothetical protein